VVGVPDAVLGQRVFGFVKLADGTKDTVVYEVLRNVATGLASYKVPEGLVILDELPRNTLGNVDRNMLQGMAAKADKTGRLQIGAAAVRPGQPDQRPVRRVAANR
jgi:acyl-coenzyme A synthetase/AMP-(fatty) acid ligase